MVWLIVDRVANHDLDYDFFFTLGLVIIIQIILLIINMTKNGIKINKEMRIKRELNENDLKKISGGLEPEEFTWKTKEYITPEKEPTRPGEWKYDAIEDTRKK